MKLKILDYRLVAMLLVFSVSITACSGGGNARPTEIDIVIDPVSMPTEAATAGPTSTPRPTETPPPPTETPSEPTPMPSPTNTYTPFEAFLFAGEQFRREGNYDQALAQFGEAIKLEPNNPTGYVYRARAYNDIGNQDQAIQDANFALNYDPNNADAYNVRGVAWAINGQQQQALKDYDKAIELNPNLASAYANRGFLNIQLKDFEKALADYSKVIELDPTAEAYFNRGQTYLVASESTGDPAYLESAALDFNQVLAMSPEQPDAHFNLGYIQMLKGELEGAIQSYSKAIELDPKSTRAFLYRGSMYRELGQCEAAFADLNQVIALTTDPEYKQPAEQMLAEPCPLPTSASSAGTTPTP